MSLVEEIRKIPPVTRFLCGSSLLVTSSVMLEVVSPYFYIFVKELVMKRFEAWRVITSFSLGSTGISYIFELVMLYQHSNQMETIYYTGRSADYAWQLVFAGAAILALNIPLHSIVHSRPLLHALVYMTSQLAPPGTETSLFGLVKFPVVYLPFALIVLDLMSGGRAAAAMSISGAVIGHLWWWSVWDTRVLRNFGTAPLWLKRLLGDTGTPSVGGTAAGGVHVVPPRRVREENQGHRWGSGHKLGSG